MDFFKKVICIALFITGTAVSATAQLALDNGYNNTDGSDVLNTDVIAPRTDLLRTESGSYVFGPATRIKFKIIEEESGLATTFFKIADLPYMKSDGRQMVPHQLQDGSYRIEYYSTDKAGNQEQVRTDNIYIDKQGPKVRAAFNASPISFENGLPIFSEEIKLIVDATDAKVNVQKLTYQINDGSVIVSENKEFIDFSDKLRDFKGKHVKIEIRAYDTFYNLSKEVVEFKIK